MYNSSKKKSIFHIFDGQLPDSEGLQNTYYSKCENKQRTKTDETFLFLSTVMLKRKY